MMQLTEKTITNVEHNTETDSLNVEWVTIVARDGVEIARTSHRRGFARSDKAAFVAALGDAASPYILAAGW